ncbi:ComEC/Rec2 family competence protein [Demequina muriae]|uniref:ComEC/Rec2 family competence protein n=1 Tax=Demequina muriae TaxID=3051664 RepID=A0ABT8GJ08_9MICO|nr:ComEC/Rec2 family competence protein [Demequina sp. EGI L300058]MDN4481420.1 ComEC/Rec2 family competence protein [Demequina sp. EGI L300058]
MSTVHDARLVPAAGAAWAAALVATSGGRVPLGVAVLLVCLGCGGAAVAMLRGSRIAATCALVCAVAGGVTGVATAQGDREAASGEAIIAAGDTEAWITVTSQATPLTGWDGGERHRVAATVSAWRPQCREPPSCAPWRASDAPVMVSLEAPPRRGDALRVEALWVASDRGRAAAVAWDARTVEVGPPSLLVAWRASFDRATAGVDPSSRGLVRGMVVGDTSSMPPSQEREMRVAGLAHLTAVSGAHFAILIMASGGAMAAMRAPRAIRAGVILAVAVIFAALVGAESSVLRALGMAVAVALATAWGRPARGLAALAASVTVLMVVEPELSGSLGFAMSVLAVAAIVLWSPRVAVTLARVVTPGLARVAAIPIVAQAAVTPVLVVIEPRLGPYAVIANLAAGIAVLPTMLVGATTLVLAAGFPWAAAAAAQLAGLCASAIAMIARVSAGAPGSWLSWPAGVLGVILAALVTACLIAATVLHHPSRRVAALVGACALTGASLAVAAGAESPVMRDWDIAVCDVGQGDMLLLRAAPGAAVVIDTGPPGGGASACLERHGVERVPVLVLTHPHQDHDGAVVSVLGAATVESAWVAEAGARGPAASALAGAGVPVEVPRPGRQEQVGRVALTVLSEAHADPGEDGNDASVIVHAAAGETTLLALGDLERRGQQGLLTQLSGGVAVDVVKVAHHGSADQLPALAARIDAVVAVVTVGLDNRHGHPTDEALELYGAGAEALLRTDLCGDVHLGTVDGALTWSRCPTDVAR